MGSTEVVDRNSPVPLFVQIREQLKTMIDGGEHPEGAKLPSLLDLAEQFGVSWGTMRRVVGDLSREGLLETVRGSGTYVRIQSGRRQGATRSLRVTPMPDIFSDEELRHARQEFRKAQPNTAVHITDDRPDVVALRGDDIPELVGDLLDVTPLVEEAYGRGPDNRDILAPLHVAGRHFMLPACINVLVIYCNVDRFEAEGVPLPRPDWTWADFLETASALTCPEENRYGFYPWGMDIVMLFQSAIWQNRGRVWTEDGRTSLINQAPALAFAALLRQLSPCVSPYHERNDREGQAQVASFCSGETAMAPASIWFPQQVARHGEPPRLAAVPLPRGDIQAGVLVGAGLGILKSSQAMDEAREFLRVAAGWEKWPDREDDWYGLHLHADMERHDGIEAACKHMVACGRTLLSDVDAHSRSCRQQAALRLLEPAIRRVLCTEDPVQKILNEAKSNIDILVNDEPASVLQGRAMIAADRSVST